MAGNNRPGHPWPIAIGVAGMASNLKNIEHTGSNERVFPGGIPESAFDAVCRPLETAQVLPPRCYTDPDFYKFEVEKVIMHSWLYACRIDDVASPGDYVTITRF